MKKTVVLLLCLVMIFATSCGESVNKAVSDVLSSDVSSEDVSSENNGTPAENSMGDIFDDGSSAPSNVANPSKIPQSSKNPASNASGNPPAASSTPAPTGKTVDINHFKGSALNFSDLADHYSLTAAQKSLYPKILAGIKTGTKEIALGKVSADDIKRTFLVVRNTHPELCNLISTTYNMKQSGPSGGPYDYALVLEYNGSKSSDTLTNEMLNAIKGIKFTDTMTDFDKELAVHDWLCSRVTYDNAAAANPEANFHAFTAYGAIVQGKAVCEGYSRAMQFIMAQLGIHTTLIGGEDSKGGPHMWNMIRIGGKWYHLDVTFNDTGSEDKGFIGHPYFNLTDALIKKDHSYKADYYKTGSGTDDVNPATISCTATDAYYFIKTGSYIKSLAEFKTIAPQKVNEAVAAGKSYAEFAFSESYGTSSMLNESYIKSNYKNSSRNIKSYGKHSPQTFFFKF